MGMCSTVDAQRAMLNLSVSVVGVMLHAGKFLMSVGVIHIRVWRCWWIDIGTVVLCIAVCQSNTNRYCWTMATRSLSQLRQSESDRLFDASRNSKLPEFSNPFVFYVLVMCWALSTTRISWNALQRPLQMTTNIVVSALN